MPTANEQAFCELYDCDLTPRISSTIAHAEKIADNPVVAIASLLMHMGEPRKKFDEKAIPAIESDTAKVEVDAAEAKAEADAADIKVEVDAKPAVKKTSGKAK